MNIINACATYTGYEENIKALRFEIPGKGKNPPTPLFLLAYSFAARATSNPGAFDEGSNVLFTGRLYKRVQTKEEKDDKCPGGNNHGLEQKVYKERKSLEGKKGVHDKSR